MPIFGHWRPPSGDDPFVSVDQLGDGDHHVTVRPGADIADLAGALDEIPADAVFVEAFGDVEAVLVFHADPPAPVVAVSATPAGSTGAAVNEGRQ